MKKKRSIESPGLIRERFCYYIEKLFGGNQRRTAHYLGCSQAVISKIVLGKQNPGGKTLNQMCQHPSVNPTWLMHGDGEPLLADRNAMGEMGWPFPIATCLLPGKPGDHRQLLTPTVQYVPGIAHRESVYAIEARYCVPDEMGTLLNILPDDILLIESDATVWSKNISMLQHRLCAIRIGRGDGDQLLLREVHIDKLNKNTRIECTSIQQIDLRLRQLAEARESLQEHSKEQRNIDLNEPNPDPSPSNSSLELNNITGLVIQLIRTF